MTETATHSRRSRSFFRTAEFQAIFFGTILALIPILWLDLFFLGVMLLALPAWGGLLVAAWILAKGGVFRPMRGILVGLAIGFLAAGLRFGLAQFEMVESYRNNAQYDAAFAEHVENQRAEPDYEAKKPEVEERLAKELEEYERFKETADWMLGLAYVFFCPIFLGLLGAVYEFFRQRKRLTG